MIACDTSALSQFLRRSTDAPNDIARNVEKLIESNELAFFGIVRQEILSGIKRPEHFERIELTTPALPLFFADNEDHTTAAKFFNIFRSKGIQGYPRLACGFFDLCDGCAPTLSYLHNRSGFRFV